LTLGNAASQRTGSPIGSVDIELRIGGMDCPHCSASVERALRALEGVSQAHVSPADGAAHVAYNPLRVKVLDLVKAIRAAGYSAGTASMRIRVKNMHCSSCVVRIELAADRGMKRIAMLADDRTRRQ
jgi:Cu+-exporting ATPase